LLLFKYTSHHVILHTIIFFVGTYPFKNSLIKAKLKQKLTAGKTYCATIYTNTDSLGSNAFTNALSMYFDNGQLDTMYTIHHDSSGYYPFVSPQVQCGFKIYQTIDWSKVQGSFVANGTEEYINIGNFLPDDSVQFDYYNIWGWQDTGQNIVIDDVSLIPIDIKNWLHDTFCAIGDSVWVGLHPLDYSDGKWYNANMQYIKTGQGFWYKPTQEVTKFIQEIDVCGAMVYDTLSVYAYPLSNAQIINDKGQLQIYPNPTTEIFIVEKVYGIKVQLINMLGEVVMEQEVLNGKAVFEVAHLPKGLYYVKGERQVGKIVME
jgi:hypothetical protein